MAGLWICIIILTVLSIVIIAWTRYSTDGDPLATTLAVLACLVVGGGIVWWNWATVYQNDHWATCTVTGKDRGGDDGSYRIYTSDCGQLANQDSILRGKFNSADIWQQIPEEGVVELRIAGMRNGLFSQFPNVFDVREPENV